MTRIDQILSGIQSIVTEYSFVAILWHVFFYCILAAVILSWSPSNKTLGILLCLPLISVSAFAWLAGNPFNGTLYAIATVMFFIFALRNTGQSVQTSELLFFITGIFMITFGLVYPHFVKPDSITGYLYVSPAGLIPCPTLSVLIGFALIFNGLGSKSISILLITFGLFYGIFGVMKLKVYIDIFLLFGALMYLAKYIFSFKTSPV